MRHFYFFIFAATIILFAPKRTLAQQKVHKLVAKTESPRLITLQQMVSLYKLGNVPSIDEYLSARGWRFTASETSDSIDGVAYIHKLPNGIINGNLTFYFCNIPNSGMCIKPEFHEGGNQQHIIQVLYKANKFEFENLQKDVRLVMKPTSSRLGSNSIVTTYKTGNVKFILTLDKSEDASSYTVFFGDVEPQSKED